MSPKKPEPLLWLDSARGQYIPRDFATSFDDRAARVLNVTDEQWATLEGGPELGGDESIYWDVWCEVSDAAVITLNGVSYTLDLSGDLWLIPVGMAFDDEADWYVWPTTKEQNR